jgi:N-acetyl-alpha-D-muramate 1-phosphate uridylyltransferase
MTPLNGMIFAAGLGTRLAPLTNDRPKALVELCGKPLIAYAIDHLYHAGVTLLVVNVHHFANQVIQYLNANAAHWPNMQIIISDESDMLLDTAGGLAKALPLFNPQCPIVVANADVLSNAPIGAMLTAHKQSGHMATLLTKQRNSTRQLLFDASGRLSGWTNKTTGQLKLPRNVDNLHESAFGGFHIIEPQLINSWLPAHKLPIIDGYLSLAAQCNIGECQINNGYYWFDVGTPEKLAVAQEFIKSNHINTKQ